MHPLRFKLSNYTKEELPLETGMILELQKQVNTQVDPGVSHNMASYFKNVLFVGPNPNLRGGMASVLEVYSKSIPDFNFIPTYNDKNIFYNIFYFVRGLIKYLARLIGDKNIKIVHLHAASRGSFLRKSIFIFIAKMLGKKTVLHIHGGEFRIFYQQTGFLRFLIRFTLDTTDEVICLSDEWKTYFDSITKKSKTIVVNNPVLLPENIRKKQPEHPVKVLFLNRITEAKGLFDVTDFFASHKNQLEGNFKLLVAGTGDTDQLQKIIGDRQLGTLIEYKGWVSGNMKDDLIQECDVFILTSYNEGLPMAILETMSFGKAVIATNVGGIPRIVRPGENGWLVKPGDTGNLQQVFSDIQAAPAKLTAYGERSRQIVQDYSPEKVKAKLNEIYTTLLTSSNGSKYYEL